MRRAVLLAVTVGLAAACGGGDSDDADATAAMVLETCAPGGDPVETEVCVCAYEVLRERYDADELERLDQQLRDDPESVPADVQEAVLDCTFDQVSPPTTKAATTTTTATTRP